MYSRDGMLLRPFISPEKPEKHIGSKMYIKVFNLP